MFRTETSKKISQAAKVLSKAFVAEVMCGTTGPRETAELKKKNPNMSDIETAKAMIRHDVSAVKSGLASAGWNGNVDNLMKTTGQFNALANELVERIKREGRKSKAVKAAFEAKPVRPVQLTLW